MDIGGAVADIRTKRKMSRAELAEVSGLTRMTVFRIETSRQDPTIGTVERLATALGVSPLLVIGRALGSKVPKGRSE